MFMSKTIHDVTLIEKVKYSPSNYISTCGDFIFVHCKATILVFVVTSTLFIAKQLLVLVETLSSFIAFKVFNRDRDKNESKTRPALLRMQHYRYNNIEVPYMVA